MESTLLRQLGLAVALGLLVGLQRERAQSQIAGIRTFPLIAVFGVFCGAFADEFGEWVLPSGLLALAVLTVMANVLKLRHEDAGSGMTTEVAVLVVFWVGVVLAWDLVLEAVVTTAGLAVLLHWKTPLHGFARALGAGEFAALMRFVLIALVVLPILPNRSYGPYGVLNPFEIWLVVVLIVGISMLGYVAFKVFGDRTGAIAAGLLGGLISSTATTVSYARRSRSSPERSASAALVVCLASAVVFGRVLVEIAIVAPEVLFVAGGPLLLMLGIMIVISLVLLRAGLGTSAGLELEDQDPPSDLGPALTFGVLYGVVLLAAAFAQDRFGDAGLYAVAALSGLTDMDAITLSTAQLMAAGGIALDAGWRMILVGAMANLLFKALVVATLGGPVMRRRVSAAFGAALLAGMATFLLWPG